MEFEIVVKNEPLVQYILSKLKDKDDYVLKQSSAEFYFKLPKLVGDEIVGISRDSLVKMKTDEPAASTAETAKETDKKKSVETVTPSSSKQ